MKQFYSRELYHRLRQIGVDRDNAIQRYVPQNSADRLLAKVIEFAAATFIAGKKRVIKKGASG